MRSHLLNIIQVVTISLVQNFPKYLNGFMKKSNQLLSAVYRKHLGDQIQAQVGDTKNVQNPSTFLNTDISTRYLLFIIINYNNYFYIYNEYKY